MLTLDTHRIRNESAGHFRTSGGASCAMVNSQQRSVLFALASLIASHEEPTKVSVLDMNPSKIIVQSRIWHHV